MKSYSFGKTVANFLLVQQHLFPLFRLDICMFSRKGAIVIKADSLSQQGRVPKPNYHLLPHPAGLTVPNTYVPKVAQRTSPPTSAPEVHLASGIRTGWTQRSLFSNNCRGERKRTMIKGRLLCFLKIKSEKANILKKWLGDACQNNELLQFPLMGKNQCLSRFTRINTDIPICSWTEEK